MISDVMSAREYGATAPSAITVVTTSATSAVNRTYFCSRGGDVIAREICVRACGGGGVAVAVAVAWRWCCGDGEAGVASC